MAYATTSFRHLQPLLIHVLLCLLFYPFPRSFQRLFLYVSRVFRSELLGAFLLRGVLLSQALAVVSAVLDIIVFFAYSTENNFWSSDKLCGVREEAITGFIRSKFENDVIAQLRS